MSRRIWLAMCLAAAGAMTGDGAVSFGQTAAVATGNWSSPATWSAGEPTGTTFATIDGGFTVTVDQTGEITNLLDVGTAAGETGNLNIIGGELTLTDSDAVAEPNLTAIRLGQVTGSTGNLTMSGGTVFIDKFDYDPAPGEQYPFANGDLLIGDNGAGNMTMTGGSLTASDEIFLGLGAGSTGALNVSGGTIDVSGRNFLVGFGGANAGAGLPGAHGELNISGTATVNVAGWLFSSFDPGATSTITQSGGTLNVSGLVVHATRGDSTFNHTGGAFNPNLFIVGDNFAGSGVHGTYNISGSATANVSAIMWLGAWGGAVGTMNQTGGTFSTGAIAVGRDGTGTLNISGGAFNQTGADGFTPNNHFVVGQIGVHDDSAEGTGFVNQTGGTVTITTGVFLGDYDNSEGTYKISGGTLNVTGAGSHPNPGDFEPNIGNFSVGGALASNALNDSLRVDPANPDDAQGQALDANGTFIVSGSAATIDIAGNFLANPADKHPNRRDDLPGDTNRANSATLGFEIFDSSGTSLIDVAGVADLDGATIDLDLMGGFTPTIGHAFDLLEAASFGSTGTGTTENVGTGEGFMLAAEDVGSWSLAVVAGAGVETLRATFLAAPGLAGDTDADGDVDGNDFLLIQRGLGGAFDASDIADWRANFGMTSPATVAAAAVPEPCAAALLLIAGAVFASARRSGSQLPTSAR